MGRRPKLLDPNHPLEAFAIELRALREEAGQVGGLRETCAAAEISESTYYAWMAGTQLPNRDALERVVRLWRGDVQHWMRRRRAVEDALTQSIPPPAPAPPVATEQIVDRPLVNPLILNAGHLESTEQIFAGDLAAMRGAKIDESRKILSMMGFDGERTNERSALTLLALAEIGPRSDWGRAKRPLLRVRNMMDWFRVEYAREYAPNSRETFRRFTLRQFVDAGIAVLNPDDPTRPVNSPRWCYQIDASVHALLTTYNRDGFADRTKEYLAERPTPVVRYASSRESVRASVTLPHGSELALESISRNALIVEVLKEFCERFTPAGEVLYVSGISAAEDVRLTALGIPEGQRHLLPDILVQIKERHWLVLVEVVTSHGSIDESRYQQLAELFKGVSANLFFVSAFRSRDQLRKFIMHVSAGTEAWCADEPSNLIGFGGGRSLAQ